MKKFLALVVSALMLIAMVPTAMAADQATVVMYEPDVLANHNTKNVGSTLATNKVTGEWGCYSGAKTGVAFTAEESGNVYLRMFDAQINATATTGTYGAFFQMNDTAVTGENVTIEMKVRIPRTEMNKWVEIRFRGDYLHGSAEHPESDSYSSGVYSVAHIMATDDGYVYSNLFTDGSRKNNATVAPYDEQWIALKWVFDTTKNSYKLYCNGTEAVDAADARFYPDGAITNSTNVVPSNLKYIQICLNSGEQLLDEAGKMVANGGEVWIDDIVFDAVASTDAPLSAIIPAFNSLENETVTTGLVNVALLNNDGTAYGKELALIIPPVDTSMVGEYTVPVENVSGVNTTWNVYRISDFQGYNFDTDSTEYSVYANINSIANNPVSSEGKALKLAAPYFNSETSKVVENKEASVCVIPDEKKGFELSFDIYWDVPNGLNQTIYTRLTKESTNYPVLDLQWTLNTSGTFTVKTNGNKIEMLSGTRTDGKMQKIKFAVDREENTIKSYLNNVLMTTHNYVTEAFAYTPETEVKKIFCYTYASSKYTNEQWAGLRDVYIDNLCVKTYESVASVDTTTVDTDVTVVKNQIPVLTETVPSTLTDGTVDVLPIKWAAVDTATTGEKSVAGTVLGFANTTVNATVNVIELPYTMNVADGTITITAPTDYTPAGKLYIATYEGGVLKGVDIYDTPVEGSTTVSASGDVKVFLLTDALVPLAEAID